MLALAVVGAVASVVGILALLLSISHRTGIIVERIDTHTERVRDVEKRVDEHHDKIVRLEERTRRNTGSHLAVIDGNGGG